MSGNVVSISSEQSDKFTGYPVFLEADHTYIHQGIGFNLSGKTASTAAAGTVTHILKIPQNGTYVHLRPTGWSTTANLGEIRIAEGTTFSGGTVAVPVNRNRNSKRLTKMEVKTAVTMITEGTVIYTQSAGTGGTQTTTGGGGSGSSNEIVFKPGQTYSFTFLNAGTVTATIFYYDLFWYEEINGEVP